MKKVQRQILENQLAIMEALNYLMMPQRPKQKEYWLNEARTEIDIRRRETGILISEDNRKKGIKAGIKAGDGRLIFTRQPLGEVVR